MSLVVGRTTAKILDRHPQKRNNHKMSINCQRWAWGGPGGARGSMALAMQVVGKGTVVLCDDAIEYAKAVMAPEPEPELDYALAGNDAAAATIDRILAMADHIVPGHFPEMIKRDGRWTWEEPAALTLLVP